MVVTDFLPMGDAPISGTAGLSEFPPDTLQAFIKLHPADLPRLHAEIRRGDCTSEAFVVDLGSLSRDNDFRTEAVMDGTFASTLPVAIVVIDESSGTVIACAALSLANLQP